MPGARFRVRMVLDILCEEDKARRAAEACDCSNDALAAAARAATGYGSRTETGLA